MQPARYIVSPLVDFLLLGGGSLLLFPLIMLLTPVSTVQEYGLMPTFLTCSAVLGYLANFPHFAYSYQLLYDNFLAKMKGELDAPLRIRYLWAGVVAPLLMVAFFAYCFVMHDISLFMLSVNFALLLSGWHYAKQGFGVLIVTSVYRRVFYTPGERSILLANANALWVYAWVMFNTGESPRRNWGIEFQTLGFSEALSSLFLAFCCATTVGVVAAMAVKYRREGQLPPFTGMVAYCTSLYVWLVLLRFKPAGGSIHPVILLVPAMHAIQYITLVLKMKANKVSQHGMSRLRFVAFVVLGLPLGALLFFALPSMLDEAVPKEGALLDTTLFVSIFAVFVNTHHFFIDNVIWRKENSEAKTYLYEIH